MVGRRMDGTSSRLSGRCSTSSPPPPRLPAEKEKSSLILRVKSDRFYMIDLNHEPDAYKSNLKLFSETPLYSPSSNSGCVMFESIIYVFGGGDRAVYYLDTRCPDAGWKIGPPMIAGRVDPYGALINGKIYVLGLDDGEVLDPLFMNQWKPLPLPPPPPPPSSEKDRNISRYRSRTVAQAVDHDQQLLLLLPCSSKTDTKRFLSCDVLQCQAKGKGNNAWKVFDEMLGSHINCSFAVVDHIKYFYSAGNIWAYDRVNRRHFGEPVRGLEGVSPVLRRYHNVNAFVVHLGNGKLCLVWGSSVRYFVGNEEKEKMWVHCTKFRISRHGGGDGDGAILSAIIGSMMVYAIDDHGHDDILNCFAV